jgi:hypothetical protein
MIVVLTHIAEAFHIFPAMGWGKPNSAGHYLDLVSAILAATAARICCYCDLAAEKFKLNPHVQTLYLQADAALGA